VSVVFLERARHCRDAPAQVFVAHDVAGDAQRPAHAFVRDHAAGLEQGHGCHAGFFDDEADLFEGAPPVGDGQGSGVDADGTREGFSDLGSWFLADGVGAHRQLVDDVASAGAQNTRGLAHDGTLGLFALHGQHRLADDDVRTLVRQPGLGRVRVHASAHARGDGIDARAGVGVALNAGIGGGSDANDRPRRNPQARGEFDDVSAGQNGSLQCPRAQGQAAGAQDRLARSREHPVSGRLIHGPVSKRQGLRWRFNAR
jgi:hypothetical protein